MPDLKSQIQDLKAQGRDNSQIIEELKTQGHSSQDIYDSLNTGGENTGGNLEAPSPGSAPPMPQSQEMGGEPMEPVPQEGVAAEPQEEFSMPAPTGPPPQIPQRQNIEQIEEIAEAIVEEKMQELSSSLGNIDMWKERVTAEINAIKQEVLRQRNHIENLQVTLAGKVDVYNKSVTSLSTEMKALSKVMEKIIQPLTMNVKDLSRIVEKFKKIK
jgi:hypothetical protein